MYLVLRPPWGSRAPSAPPADAPVVATAPDDAKAAAKKKRPRHGGPGRPGSPGGTDEDEPEPPPLSDADRRLEWRGEEVSVPTTRLDMGTAADARPLDDSEINSTIVNQSGPVRDCVVQSATGTDLRATITIKMLVDGKGHVTKSRVEAPHYLFEHGLLTCAQRALGRMVFPPTHAPTLVTLPVNLG